MDALVLYYWKETWFQINLAWLNLHWIAVGKLTISQSFWFHRSLAKVDLGWDIAIDLELEILTAFITPSGVAENLCAVVSQIVYVNGWYCNNEYEELPMPTMQTGRWKVCFRNQSNVLSNLKHLNLHIDVLQLANRHTFIWRFQIFNILIV